jgi:hypothetical protein
MLQLPTGDWLLVKKHLTYGDQQRIFARMWHQDAGSVPKIDTLLAGGSTSQIIEYLLDWSITDADGKPIKLQDSKGEPDPGKIRKALEDLDGEDVKIIADAIGAHDQAMQKEREAEKNGQAGASASPATSASAA